ncbi:FAD-dependent oxidoreductase [Nocardioides jishulii]|uniref:FAD-binding protein n=1 Tax=Nocardioides jishulii TaxID=2575440 RepID=A0A4U2YJ19_9ACTN|nr:FAD-binding protein [Nocardioides jishulii]QCX28010.1 FAD-binding protein [Nocardioides jishulii]TKI60674.1 FAD-binding protein [Nocardioides jishulii]
MSEAGPDLVVAGAGGGLLAALRAARNGLQVLVVEASEHYRRGNNTSISTAMIPGVGSRWQSAAGVDDSVERFVDDVARKTKGQGDLALAAALARASAPMLEWMADDLGFPLSLVTDFQYPGHSAHRCHTLEGRHGSVLLDQLVRAVEAEERIDLFVPARLTDVLLDDDGAVRAVVVTTPDGSSEEIETRAVLLATNGYAGNPELVAQYLPEIADAQYHGSETSRGDALRIGTALGADVAHLDAYQGHAALSKHASTLVGWATVMHGGVVVNAEGRRFGDETAGYSEFAPLLAREPGAEGWIIVDREIHTRCLAFTDYVHCVEAGAVLWADDVEQLAAVTKLPVDALAAELAATAAAATGERVDDFGRTDFDHPLAGPYAAVKIVPALFHSQGGLVVDADARVLRGDGTAIEGLYASGGAAQGISGHGASGYLAGNGLLPALGLAYLAADHVASAHPDA